MTRKRGRKLKDKWRNKKWYTIYAPSMFDHKNIGETVSDSKDKLLGRILITSLHDITGDISKSHVKLKFKIYQITDSGAETVFIGHRISTDYIRRLIRRNISPIYISSVITTKDGYKVRIKPFAITSKKVQSSVETVLRNKIVDIINKNTHNLTIDKLVESILSGNLGRNIYNKCKSIYPFRRVEIYASEVEYIPESVYSKTQVEQPATTQNEKIQSSENIDVEKNTSE